MRRMSATAIDVMSRPPMIFLSRFPSGVRWSERPGRSRSRVRDRSFL